ncbi:MAG: hypothetical protein JHC33_02350, partial [Ignisphaera sp.]|nr:hypothetical protein [Ignisphaera sp.]
MSAALYPIFSSPHAINKQADDALIEGLQTQFPIENKNFELKLSNVHADKKEFSQEDEKQAILKSKSLTYPIKGDLTLISKATGKVVDIEKNFTLMDSFSMTGKHTLIYNGNNYVVANQLQLRPGVYTRSKESGELESHINTATGRSFSITLDPKSSLFYINVASSTILLAPLLYRVFGIGKTEVYKYIPSAVWDANVKAAEGKETKLIGDMYNKLVSTALRTKNANTDQMALDIKNSLEQSQLSTLTTKITLGKSIDAVRPEAILLALHNLVQVHTGEREEDNRDSLQFKRVQNLPDYLSRRFEKEHASIAKIKSKLSFNLEKLDANAPRIRAAIPAKPFNKVYSSYILDSPLVSTPSETNPLESLENVGKVTVLGADEGGIGDERGVPMTARNIDPSHLGIIDPTRTPESSHAGIDQRFTINARRDRAGNLYSRVLDLQGKPYNLSVSDLMNSVVGFPHQEGKKVVQAQDHGQLKEVPRSTVQYWIPDATSLYTVTTNLVPFLNSNHPGRLTMAGKALPQALSLVNREIPLVQTMSESKGAFIKQLGAVVSTISPVHGVIHSVSDKKIVIKGDDGKKTEVIPVKNLPFNMKGFLDDEAPLVKEGDRVKPGQVLLDNNYTRDGNLTLGKNLTVSYLPYKGYNHEDGIVISHSAAASLSSHHSYKVDYDVVSDSIMKKGLLRRYYPNKFTKEQLDNLDDAGFAKVGSTMHHGDPIYAVLEKREATPEDKMLGRLHKNLVNPYRLVTEEWNHQEPGSVVDAHTEGKSIRILLRSVKELEVGDKLTGLHGNKGIVSLVLPDHEMPYNKDTGKPVDMLLNPASVTSRINLGQIMETVAGKLALKRGTPYLLHNFSNENNLTALKKQLADEGVSDTETLIDPKTGKQLDKVLTGPQYILKLYKTSDQNLSARNVGAYDNVLQPTKGGEQGSKSVGYMEMLGLLGSNSRHNLKEIATTKSEDNSEYWSKFLNGQALPKPKTTFATNKFFNYLTGAGIKVSHENGNIIASPLTDHDIMGMSNGALTEPLMLSAKNTEPEEGGLFDPSITGGIKGNKWSHYKLAEPIVHPVF